MVRVVCSNTRRNTSKCTVPQLYCTTSDAGLPRWKHGSSHRCVCMYAPTCWVVVLGSLPAWVSSRLGLASIWDMVSRGHYGCGHCPHTPTATPAEQASPVVSRHSSSNREVVWVSQLRWKGRNVPSSRRAKWMVMAWNTALVLLGATSHPAAGLCGRRRGTVQ